MKYHKILLALAFLGILNRAYPQDDCRPIKISDPDKIDAILAQSIDEPGHYCLLEDIKSPRLYDVHGEKSTGSPMLRIRSSNVEINLKKHTMVAATHGMSGVTVVRAENKEKLPSHISIKNGKVSSRTSGALRLAFEEGSLLSDFMTKYSGNKKLFEKDYEKVQKASADVYPLTENIVESMSIEANTSGRAGSAGMVGVGMQGRGNIVRNSTIEITGGHATVYLFGPNNVIENNIIIFKGKSAYESAAAIKLHHSDGTIIRNNDIVIRSAFGNGPDAAISIIDSKDVIIENNRIYGTKTLARTWGGKSTTIERNNEFRNLLHAPSASGEPDVQR